MFHHQINNITNTDTDEKIQFARGRSNVFKRLEGAYKAPATEANAPAEGQSSIFTAPLPSSTGNVAPPNAPDVAPVEARGESEGPQGVKRRREDESEEDEDSDVSMEASSDEEE